MANSLKFLKKDSDKEECLDTWKVLVVDDEKSIHEVTSLVLRNFSFDNKKLNIINAYSAKEAKEVLSKHNDIALVLLDVVMESDDAGLKVVKYIREELENSDIRIVIRTGQAGIVPENKIVIDYDINDFKEKTELTSVKLFTVINLALKSYREILNLRELQQKVYEQKLKENEQKKVTEAKDAFLVLFSHELKTPLNAIMNFTRYLLRHVSARTIHDIPLAKREKLLKQIEKSAIQMLDDITCILELSKIKANKLEYKIKRFNLVQTLKDVIYNHETLSLENEATISFECNCGECYVESDIYRFKQIFANVISNAIKYSRGEVHIIVECFEDKYLITVEDNGLGVEDKEKIFELFEQNDKDILTRNSKGTGVGLTFVKYLCKGLDIGYKVEDSEQLGGLSFQFLVKSKIE